MFSFFKKQKGPDFISGRVATRKEVKFGFFSVVRDDGHEISKPYNIIIPQEATYINNETKEQKKGILIQAEEITETEMKGKVICTLRLENGQTMSCFLEELKHTNK